MGRESVGGVQVRKSEPRSTALIMTLMSLCLNSLEQFSTFFAVDGESAARVKSTHLLLTELSLAMRRWQVADGKQLTADGLDERAYRNGYETGWQDAMQHTDFQAQPLAWAIVCRDRQRVRFETVKPAKVKGGEVVIALYARPDLDERGGR
jgi:hypothetical protein